MKPFNRFPYFVFILAQTMMVVSCSDYLDVKPDQKLSTPTTPSDLQAILDVVPSVNNGNPGLGEVACDNFFMSYEDWQSIATREDREIYIWQKIPVNAAYWSVTYQKIYYVNTVLDHLEKLDFSHHDQKMRLYGQAMFVRGMTFHKLAEVFSVPYDAETAAHELGIVLRTSSDINVKSMRSSLAETYRQAILDLERAAQHLDENIPEYPTRPSRAAAYGALARCYLSMREYEKAGKYADSCLVLKADLLNYNDYPVGQPYPFELYNDEVIYHSSLSATRNLQENMTRVDTLLYDSYAPEDLRKTLFFSLKDDGYHAFTGDYARGSSSSKFDGITTAEIRLIHAECLARAGNYENAKAELLELLRNRYRTGENLSDGVPATADALVDRIIDERRKELIGRGLRWSDIRRLSFEEGRSVDLIRNVGGEPYYLNAQQQQKFAFYLPTSVIELGGIPQND